MVSREVYGRHVCILRMLCVLSCLPVLPRAFALVLLAVAPVLPSRLLFDDFNALPEATALGAQNPNPVVTTFRGCEFVID